jgi:hypothetical protein
MGMSPPGRPKGESLSAQREGSPVNSPRRSMDESADAMTEARVPSRVVLHVERLVLNGFAAGDQAAVAAGLQHELQRLLAERAATVPWTTGVDLPRLRVGTVQVRAGMSAGDIGTQAARGIGRGLARAARSDPHG